jgi:hypothetical protein
MQCLSFFLGMICRKAKHFFSEEKKQKTFIPGAIPDPWMRRFVGWAPAHRLLPSP